MTSRRAPASRFAGAAIVIAMLLAALAAAVAATVFSDQRRWAENVQHRRDQVQAQALAMAGIQWTRQILQDDARRGSIDHPGEPWAIPLPAVPLENGSIAGAIADAQARLNVNALGQGDAVAVVTRARLQKLFAQRGVDPAALATIGDWIDADAETRAGGAEDARYLAASVPYLAANAPVLRLSELADVAGVSPATLAALAPFVAALPGQAAVNVNTAPAEVLATIVGNASPEALAQLVADRVRKPFSTVAEFRARLPQGATLDAETGLAVNSSYFLVTVDALQGITRGRARALLRREGTQWPAVVWQVVE
jgi:general secretion pathway protein K